MAARRSGQGEKKTARARTQKATDALVQQAKDLPASASGKQVGAVKARSKRDAQIILDANLGLTWPEISAKYKITERRAQQIYAGWRDGEMEVFDSQDAMTLVFEFVARYEALESRFASLADTADSDSARVGALKALVDTTTKRLILLQATGKLPRDLGKLQVEIDVRHVSRVLVGVFQKYGLPPEAMREVQTLLSGN